MHALLDLNKFYLNRIFTRTIKKILTKFEMTTKYVLTCEDSEILKAFSKIQSKYHNVKSPKYEDHEIERKKVSSSSSNSIPISSRRGSPSSKSTRSTVKKQKVSLPSKPKSKAKKCKKITTINNWKLDL